MNKSASFTTLCAVVLGLSAAGTVGPGVLEFEDKDEWLDAIGGFVTVDFTGFEPGTVITDQYADLGVLFVDGFYTIFPFDPISFPNDGWGLDGNGNITVVFDTPMTYIGVDYAGHMHFELYSDGVLFYESSDFTPGGVGNFAGLLSSEPFDMAVLMDVPPPFQAAIDDLYFGPAACPADLDGDDTVGILDLLQLLIAWGVCPNPPDRCPADFDNNGTVGITDLLTLLAAWGECP